MKLLLVLTLLSAAVCDELVISPSEFMVGSDETSELFLAANCNQFDASWSQQYHLEMSSMSGDPSSILSINSTSFNLSCSAPADQNISLSITGKLLGFVELTIFNSTDSEVRKYALGVIRPEGRIIDQVFLIGIIIIQIVNTILFGVSLDLKKVKEFLKKPIAPGIGVVGQFIIMPLTAFTLTFAISKHPSLEFGLFAAGVAPGGGGSNIWCYLLGGDVDLSITMTFISSILAIGFVPAWIYSLGPIVVQNDSIKIPFPQMVITLSYVVLPVAVGLLINKFLPKVAKFLNRIKRYVILAAIIFIISVAITANIYIFKLIFSDYQLALPCLSLPYAGGITAYLLARICRQGHRKSTTIGLETAIQNTSIAIIMLRNSLPQPWGDLSSAFPVCLNLFIPILLQTLFVLRVIYVKGIKKESLFKNQDGKTDGDDPDKSPIVESGVTQKVGNTNFANSENDLEMKTQNPNSKAN